MGVPGRVRRLAGGDVEPDALGRPSSLLNTLAVDAPPLMCALRASCRRPLRSRRRPRARRRRRRLCRRRSPIVPPFRSFISPSVRLHTIFSTLSFNSSAVLCLVDEPVPTHSRPDILPSPISSLLSLFLCFACLCRAALPKLLRRLNSLRACHTTPGLTALARSAMLGHTSHQRRSHDPSRHAPSSSVDSAAGESTISFNTLATGLSAFTGDTTRLSQFPQPPEVLPSPVRTEGYVGGLPSPASSGSTASALEAAIARVRGQQQQPSPLPRDDVHSTPPSATAPLPGQVVRTAPAAFHPSPHSGQFPESPLFSPLPPPPPPPPVRQQTRSDTRQVLPTDWHDGSSSIDVQPMEAKMLSTNIITELLSSADSVISSGSSIPSSSHPPHGQRGRYGSVSQFSEMTYPPPPMPLSSSRYPPYHPSSQLDHIHEILARSDDPYTASYADQRTDNDTIASFDGNAEVVRYAGVSRKVSVVGMTSARMTQVLTDPEPSLAQSSLRDSYTTFNSLHPLQRQLSIPATAEELEASPLSSPAPMPDHPMDHYHPPSSGASPGHPSIGPPPPSALRVQQRPMRRSSVHSNKSMKSQVSSFISAAGDGAARLARSTVEWFRVKPLPPVPTVRDMTLEQERQHKQHDLAQPLPELVRRADRLNGLLAQGKLPANSIVSGSGMLGREGYEKIGFHNAVGDVRASGTAVGFHAGGRKRQSVGAVGAFAVPGVVAPSDANGSGPSPTKRRLKLPATRRGKIRLALAVGVATALVVVAIVVGVVVSHGHGVHCSGSMTGAACTLDATCVCTQPSGQGQCIPVAASLINTLPNANANFGSNLTSSDVAASVLAAFGGQSTDCSAQARVIDVATALDASVVPNRTAWAQSALMWTFVLSQSPASVAKLQNFVRGADWKSVENIDGPIPSASSRFSTTMLGFTYDFAGQTIKAPSVSFATDGQPSSAQLSRVSDAAAAALDRVYTAASAMSTLTSTAITTYWTSSLGRNAQDYASFVSALIASPVLLPFNAANSSIASLLTASSSTPFPPPASCYPGLSSAALGQLSAVETQVFGLSSPAPQSAFDTSCYADRPIYGVLDYLHLRLPYSSSNTNPPVQAAVLSADVRPRVVISNGQQFGALPDGTSPATVQTDVREYGTTMDPDHIIKSLFDAIDNVDLANALVDYVLSQTPVPPVNTSTLVQNLASLPVIEVAVFGSVLPADIDAVYSSFSTPSGQLFFGTDGSVAVRTWALNATQTFVAWTESATAAKIVHDASYTDLNFNSVWNPAFMFFHSITNSVVSVSNITASFQNVNEFKPT